MAKPQRESSPRFRGTHDYSYAVHVGYGSLTELRSSVTEKEPSNLLRFVNCPYTEIDNTGNDFQTDFGSGAGNMITHQNYIIIQRYRDPKKNSNFLEI